MEFNSWFNFGHSRERVSTVPESNGVMNTQGEKGVDSHAERSRCLFRLCRWQESWSQAGIGHTQVGKQAGESKLGLQAITGSHK